MNSGGGAQGYLRLLGPVGEEARVAQPMEMALGIGSGTYSMSTDPLAKAPKRRVLQLGIIGAQEEMARPR